MLFAIYVLDMFLSSTTVCMSDLASLPTKLSGTAQAGVERSTYVSGPWMPSLLGPAPG